MSCSHPLHLLIIDGNNLAHHLYPHLRPGQKLTSADTWMLLEHLSSYARSHTETIALEVCLDRAPRTFPILPHNLRILAAEYPQIADDVLLGQFWFHLYQKRNDLVVTNDGAILDEIQQAGGRALRVYDFVRRVGPINPVFLTPDELPIHPPAKSTEEEVTPRSLRASIYFRITEARKNVRKNRPATRPAPLHAHSFPTDTLPGAAIVNEPPGCDASCAACDAATRAERSTPPAEARDPGPYYFLNLDHEPLQEGAHFLRGAFCKTHRTAYRDLINAIDPTAMNHADLRSLAGLLLDACGAEEDFCRRGSLMDRVKQSLLLAGDEPLSIRELAQATSIPQSGLRQKIRAKGRGWIVIIED